MKKAIIVGIFMFISLFAFVPVQAHAVSFSDGVLIAAKTNISDLTDGYNQTQDCDGSDSLLGNPDDENSVAWLLNKILTYLAFSSVILTSVLR